MSAGTAVTTALRARVIEDAAELAGHAAAWDALVDATSKPFCVSGWLLSWWANACPAGARLAVVLVEDASGALAGLAPYFLQRAATGLWRWRPLAAGACERVEPLALPGAERAVAAAVAAALAAHTPRPDMLTFEGIPDGSPWPGLLAAAWPGGARGRTTGGATALTLELADTDFDGWFMSKSKHFRQRLRRQNREATEQGGVFRLADAESAGRDVEAFLRVHVDRWADRGGSGGVGPAVAAMLRGAGPDLVAAGRLRIWSLDLGGETIASSLVFCAGQELGYWLNGFAREHACLEPSKISILRVIEDAFALGADRLDLGEGVYEYKQRFAGGEEALRWETLIPPAGRRRPLVEAALAPGLARRFAAARVPVETRRKLNALVRREAR